MAAGASDRREDASVRFRRHVLPLLAGYWSFGQFWGVWVILVYELQRDRTISDAGLGIDYMLTSLTAVAAMLFLAPRLQGLPLRSSVPMSLATLGLATTAAAAVPDAGLVLAFALIGLGNGLIDVYLNVAAQRLEVRSRRPVLQWLHASYALGGVTGAMLAGAIRAAGLDYRLGFALEAAALFATAAWTAATVTRDPPAAAVRTSMALSPLFRTPALWVPALIVMATFLVEGSMDVWSGLYLRDQLGASAAVAATVFVAFAGAAFVGRLVASRVLFGRGRRATIVVAGVGATASGAIAVLTDSVLVVGAAFLLLGFTISAVSPAGFGMVEELAPADDQANALAAVTTIGYTGFIWSPPLLGWLAQTLSLRAAMATIVVATLGIVAGGLAAPRAGPAVRSRPD
ncbi:MAG: MFS transporter [Actinomycetota bacterium]